MTARTPLRLDPLIRCSQQSKRTGDSYRSPGQQSDAIRRYAEDPNRKVVLGTWEDATVGVHSAKTVERDEVDRIVQRIKDGQSDGMIVMSLDRFSRAPLLETLTVYKAIEDAGGCVVATDMPFDDPTSPEAELIVTNMHAFHRYQWRKTADRYALSRREAIADGKAIGGEILGYRFKDGTTKDNGRGVRDSRLVVYEPERAIVLELFERKAGGATWLELTRWLDTVAPKPGGRKWARSTVSDMIARRTYLGEVHHGDFKKAGAHEAIVPAALWRRAQRPPGRRTPRGTYLSSGKALCAGCSRSLRGSKLNRTETRRVYTCDTPECTERSTVMVDLLDAEILDQFFAHLDEFHVRAVDDAELIEARADVERIADEVDAHGAITPPNHPRAIAAHQTKFEELVAALNAAEDHRDHLLASIAEGGPDARELRADWPNLTLAEQREVLGAGIDAVLVRKAARRGPASKGTLHPIRERILVLFTGDAPDGLVNNGRGPIRRWSWDRDPSTLVAAA